MSGHQNPYLQLFKVPGAKSFSISAALARLPMSMISLGIVLAINHLYGNWTSAGTLSAVYVISAAVATPVFARLFDRYGQRVVGRVALPLSVITLAAFAASILFRFPMGSLYVMAILMGLTQFSFGALVRTRWTWVLRRDSENSPETKTKMLASAYSFESAVDELIYVIGPVLATFLATAVHPVSQLFVPLIALAIGGTVFFALRSAAAPAMKVEEVHVERSAEIPYAPTVSNETVEQEEIRHSRRHSRRSPIALMRTMKTRTALGFPGMLLVVASFTVFSMSFSAYDVCLVAMTKEQGQEYIVGVVMATMACGSLVGALIYGSRQWRGSLWVRYLLCLTILTLGFIAFTFVRGNLLVLCIMQFIIGLFVSPTFATCNMIIEDSVPGVYLTEGLSWLSTASAVGSSLGSTLAGVLIDQSGVAAGFSIPWVAVLATVIIVLVFRSGLLRSLFKGRRSITA
ncbi:MAG: MFS transporter [Bifidobacteriaceae bacterium]|jgi:MFS family permease|nr:MFS transporter [Bifidobacteriaceae bacterium]MCI1979244.1 MFS transporter [Bifidobacteriaceae bacterium]